MGKITVALESEHNIIDVFFMKKCQESIISVFHGCTMVQNDMKLRFLLSFVDSFTNILSDLKNATVAHFLPNLHFHV